MMDDVVGDQFNFGVSILVDVGVELCELAIEFLSHSCTNVMKKVLVRIELVLALPMISSCWAISSRASA